MDVAMMRMPCEYKPLFVAALFAISAAAPATAGTIGATVGPEWNNVGSPASFTVDGSADQLSNAASPATVTTPGRPDIDVSLTVDLGIPAGYDLVTDPASDFPDDAFLPRNVTITLTPVGAASQSFDLSDGLHLCDCGTDEQLVYVIDTVDGIAEFGDGVYAVFENAQLASFGSFPALSAYKNLAGFDFIAEDESIESSGWTVSLQGVEAVPLPLPAVGLITGLGALIALRRRRPA